MAIKTAEPHVPQAVSAVASGEGDETVVIGGAQGPTELPQGLAATQSPVAPATDGQAAAPEQPKEAEQPAVSEVEQLKARLAELEAKTTEAVTQAQQQADARWQAQLRQVEAQRQQEKHQLEQYRQWQAELEAQQQAKVQEWLRTASPEEKAQWEAEQRDRYYGDLQAKAELQEAALQLVQKGVPVEVVNHGLQAGSPAALGYAVQTWLTERAMMRDFSKKMGLGQAFELWQMTPDQRAAWTAQFKAKQAAKTQASPHAPRPVAQAAPVTAPPQEPPMVTPGSTGGAPTALNAEFAAAVARGDITAMRTIRRKMGQAMGKDYTLTEG